MVCYCCLLAQSCLTLCDPMNCSLLGSSVHGIFQARILEWVAVSFSRGYFWPRDRTCVSCIAGRFFTTVPPGKHQVPVMLMLLVFYTSNSKVLLRDDLHVIKFTFINTPILIINRSILFSKFIELCNHHNPMLECLHYPSKISNDRFQLLPIPTSSPRQRLIHFPSL